MGQLFFSWSVKCVCPNLNIVLFSTHFVGNPSCFLLIELLLHSKFWTKTFSFCTKSSFVQLNQHIINYFFRCYHRLKTHLSHPLQRGKAASIQNLHQTTSLRSFGQSSTSKARLTPPPLKLDHGSVLYAASAHHAFDITFLVPLTKQWLKTGLLLRTTAKRLLC